MSRKNAVRGVSTEPRSASSIGLNCPAFEPAETVARKTTPAAGLAEVAGHFVLRLRRGPAADGTPIVDLDLSGLAAALVGRPLENASHSPISEATGCHRSGVHELGRGTE